MWLERSCRLINEALTFSALNNAAAPSFPILLYTRYRLFQCGIDLERLAQCRSGAFPAAAQTTTTKLEVLWNLMLRCSTYVLEPVNTE
jgi:hypothetical protein